MPKIRSFPPDQAPSIIKSAIFLPDASPAPMHNQFFYLFIRETVTPKSGCYTLGLAIDSVAEAKAEETGRPLQRLTERVVIPYANPPLICNIRVTKMVK